VRALWLVIIMKKILQSSGLAFFVMASSTHAFDKTEYVLDTLVVTASKSPEEIFKTPAHITVLTQDDIQQSGVRSVNEAIVKLGGLIGRPSLFGGNELTLDAMGFGETAASNMVFIIDGVTYKEGDQSEVRIGNIQLDEVERIEIQKGGSSVLYGDSAVSGVVNNVTRASGWNPKNQTSGSVQTGFGSDGAEELKFSASKTGQGTNLTVSGSHLYSNGFRENSANYSDNVLLGIQHATESTRAGLSLSKETQYAKTPGSLSEDQYATDRNQANSSNKSVKTFNDLQKISYGVFVEKDFDSLLLRVDVKQRDKDYFFLDQKGGYPSSASISTLNNTYGINLSHNQKYGFGGAYYIVGLDANDWVQNRVTQDFGNYHNVSSAQALFAKGRLSLESINTTFGLGARREQVDRSSVGYKTPEYYEARDKLKAWEISVLHELNLQNSLWAKVSSNYRMPNIDEISNAYAEFVTYSPLDLKPQISLDQELGWHRKFDKTRTRARLFRSNYKNEIAYDRAAYVDLAGGYYVGSNINFDRTQRQGIDLSLNHAFSPELILGTSATYQQSEFTSGNFRGKKIPLSPETILSANANWRFEAKQTIGLSFQYIGKQHIGSDFANQYTMPAYYTADIRYGYKQGPWAVDIFIRNLLDKDYYSFATNTYEGLTRSTAIYPDMKRSYFVNLKYLMK
jgi:iron complex outermembrane receptor protein